MRITSTRLSLGLVISLASALLATPSFAQTTHEFEATTTTTPSRLPTRWRSGSARATAS